MTPSSKLQHTDQKPFGFELDQQSISVQRNAKTAMTSSSDGCFMVRDNVLLTRVPANISVTPATGESAFIGATSEIPSSRHVFSLGVLEGYKFMCLFRFKIWWMIPGFGNSGCDVPAETQMLLLEARDKSSSNSSTPDQYRFSSESEEPENAESNSTFYILLLPVLDGAFRATLQGNTVNELEFCVESGDPDVQTSTVTEAVFVNSGDDPYKLIRDSIKILAKHKGTFNYLEDKKVPAHVDWFGWNTWDAFYNDVDPEGIVLGLKSLSGGGCPPKCLYIDEGWQTKVVENEFELTEKAKFVARLVSLEENDRFKGYPSGKSSFPNLHEFVKTIKEEHGLKLVYAWHALLGSWGGLLPTSEALRKYNPQIKSVVQSPGNKTNIICETLDPMEKHGIGMIDPSMVYKFYNDLHTYLASCNIDGVKVDIQNQVELLSSGYGGRVALMRHFQEALEESVMRNFGSNNLICSMSLSNDYIYSSKKSAASRVSEDFMPREKTFQTLHVAAVAFNSLLMGEIVVPDWDMFFSDHFTREFHAAARALGGCPIYVSDKPGSHNFDVLKRLVLPDGSILRARFAGRPTRDCLFSDPVVDGKSLLKIWNLNKLSGVVGVFNCQRAGKWPPIAGAEYVPPLESALPLRGLVCPKDINMLEDIANESWQGECAVYAFRSGIVSVLPKKDHFEVSLNVLECEVFTISPTWVFGENIQFAPIGLLDMYNSGGALESLDVSINDMPNFVVKVQVRGCGRFGAYSNKEPRSCLVDNKKEFIIYNSNNGLLVLELQGDCKAKEIEVMY
ncbi:probable galactinol--sucrose galactosyltransferase 2 [Argentina anserina]|uniref:probable galactinol--sucrose galactosyltransferase 2 n=1 Tax=Argentina anserina TaxID=57926 RepID=UPI002176624F|nr:probable galactinol--sucrose galactosyltransferase 2 [Potentilla anserina]